MCLLRRMKLSGALCSLLKDDSGQVRYEAAYGLARIGSKAGSAVKALTKALYDDENRAGKRS